MEKKLKSKNSSDEKIERIRKTLKERVEPDKVPLHDFYWEEFLDRWKKELNLPQDTNIYEYYDMDMMIIPVNWETGINQINLIEKGEDYILYEDGFGATIKKFSYAPMQRYVDFKYKKIDDLVSFKYDDPLDDKRYNGKLKVISYGEITEIPSFNDQVKYFKDKFCLFGSVCEGYEAIWRIHGPENSLINIAVNKEIIKKEIDRVVRFMTVIGIRQLETSGINGIMIYGDVAYKKGMMFSPSDWREIFKPPLKEMVAEFKKFNVPIIYHGCGNATEIFDDLIEIGIDGYHSLEVKAGIDVLELKNKYKNKLAYLGNIDALKVLTGSKKVIKEDLLKKLHAAIGGGYMPAADHSVPYNVSGESYDYFISLIKDYGRYPLNLGECDIDMD